MAALGGLAGFALSLALIRLNAPEAEQKNAPSVAIATQPVTARVIPQPASVPALPLQTDPAPEPAAGKPAEPAAVAPETTVTTSGDEPAQANMPASTDSASPADASPTTTPAHRVAPPYRSGPRYTPPPVYIPTTPSYSYTPSYSGSKTVHVRGYYRKNGTYVQPHYRRSPRR